MTRNLKECFGNIHKMAAKGKTLLIHKLAVIVDVARCIKMDHIRKQTPEEQKELYCCRA